MSQPETDQMTLPTDTVEINDLNQFVSVLTEWHSHRVTMLKHLREAPETVEVSVGNEEAIRLDGDFRKGFQLGISLALSEMGELPFVAEMEESAATELKH